MNEMTYDEFQALLRRLIPVEGQPRDEAAWGKFWELFEPTVRYYARVSGGRAPLLQGIMDTHDMVDSVWRKTLQPDWVRTHLLRKSISEARAYLAKVAWNHKLGEIRDLPPVGHVSLDAAQQVPDSRQPSPPEESSRAELERQAYARLRAVCRTDEEFTNAQRLLRGETTYQALAREEYAKRETNDVAPENDPKKKERAIKALAKRCSRWFQELLERLDDGGQSQGARI